MPDEVETFPWAGHLGITLLPKVLPILQQSSSTLIFTNTRSQCEIWYQRLLEAEPELTGLLAMHHGSIDRELRDWVEDALHSGALKAVVCTSSLDLGVDFRPVETIVQIGSPKGVARFVQRAGRSGHQPGATSIIHFVPTNTIEIIEAAALRAALERGAIEARRPYLRSFDVLVQYLVTLAVDQGFSPARAKKEICQTHAFASITDEEFEWCLNFITEGGNSLGAYDEFHKVVRSEITNADGEIEPFYSVTSKRVAQLHRLNMGAIVSEASLKVRYLQGAYLGTVEEFFLSQLRPGDSFWFAGNAWPWSKSKAPRPSFAKAAPSRPRCLLGWAAASVF
ncbi:MAG: hypothetical protein HC821_00015 [Lewinella sp.]|nr:hypothetical protein [Lewinella sp.]